MGKHYDKYIKYKKKYISLTAGAYEYPDADVSLNVNSGESNPPPLTQMFTPELLHTPHTQITTSELKESFLKYIENYKHLNNTNVDDSLRIATFNVHYFTDINEKDTYESILNVIHHLNADIIILQEVIVGGKIIINENTTINVSNLYDDLTNIGYKKKILCNSVPSWFQGIYGNLLLMKNKLCINKKNSLHKLCEENNETIHTFEKSKECTVVSGSHEGTNETRCYIYCKFNYHKCNFHIFGFHLDVGTEVTRLEQINNILVQCDCIKLSDPEAYIILLGDFNTTATSIPDNEFLKNNGVVYDKIVSHPHNYYDCSKLNKEKDRSKMTTWNNQVVDFIFCNKNLLSDDNFGAEFDYYYTNSSDHLPIFITLKPKKFKNSKKLKYNFI
uniref:Endonuclease/exonuclease/phosphatase domain-containing protein n=1 Tax=viral metagenome TaxID=1070528 RepID=A0A6C0H9E2_9ZZZZ